MQLGETRDVHAVPVPKLTIEDGIALLSKTALDTHDQTLVNIAADIAGAYGNGDPQTMEGPYQRLSAYMSSLYAAGQSPPYDLIRASMVIREILGPGRANIVARRGADDFHRHGPGAFGKRLVARRRTLTRQ